MGIFNSNNKDDENKKRIIVTVNDPVLGKISEAHVQARAQAEVLIPSKEEAEGEKRHRLRELMLRTEAYKPMWDKNGVIQFKTSYVAVLQRAWGQ